MNTRTQETLRSQSSSLSSQSPSETAASLGAKSVLLLHLFREARLLEQKRRQALMAMAMDQR